MSRADPRIHIMKQGRKSIMKKMMLITMLCLSLGLLGTFSAGANEVILANAPDYYWWYGCSPTSAGMMMGYYDINGYKGLRYDNLVPGGTAELDTFTGSPGWGALANNVIASKGHVNDFYVGGYGVSGDDRIPPPPYHNFNSLADFMGTSQDSVGHSNGLTAFYHWPDSAKYTAQDALNEGVSNKDGMYGMLEYLKYAGYDATQIYTQLTDNKVSGGFSFANYMAEIDAGRVVMIQVEGHSMFGYGYDYPTQTVYLHDTWSLGEKSMTWGGSYPSPYGDLAMWGVVVMEPTVVPEPATMFLLGSCMLALAGFRRWFKRQ